MVRSLGARLFLRIFVFALPLTSFAKKFIIRVRQEPSTTQRSFFATGILNHQKLLSLQKKMNDNPRIRSNTLHHVRSIVAEASSLEEIKAQLSSDLSISYIEEDKPIHLATLQSDNYGEQLNNSPYLKILGFETNNPSQYSASFSPLNSSDKPLLVAVIDTGMNLEHPFLKPFVSRNDGETGLDANGNDKTTNGMDDDLNGYVDDVNGVSVVDKNGDAKDIQYHGTHVSGLVKTIRDHALASGYSAALKIQVLPIRFFYKCEAVPNDGQICGSVSSAITALDYALSRGAKVINMSWGSDTYSQALYETLSELYQKDITLVAAAGNNSLNVDDYPFFPAALNPCLPGLISVNSITTAGENENSVSLSSFSNYSSQFVNISAPGHSVYNNTFGLLSSSGSYPFGDKFIALSGTSMASPLVAGITAVMRSLNPTLSAHDIRDVLISSATIPYDLNTNSKILSHKNQVDGYAHALKSFENALSSPHLKTNNIESCSFNPVSGFSSSTQKEQSNGGGGGCAALISAHGSNDDTNNPLGGNSLGLLTSLFFFVQFLRRMSYKISRC